MVVFDLVATFSQLLISALTFIEVKIVLITLLFQNLSDAPFAFSATNSEHCFSKNMPASETCLPLSRVIADLILHII